MPMPFSDVPTTPEVPTEAGVTSAVVFVRFRPAQIAFWCQEHLPRVNQIRIADLLLVGLVDRRIANALSIKTPGDPPQVIPLADDNDGKRLFHFRALAIGSSTLTACDHLGQHNLLVLFLFKGNGCTGVDRAAILTDQIGANLDISFRNILAAFNQPLPARTDLSLALKLVADVDTNR